MSALARLKVNPPRPSAPPPPPNGAGTPQAEKQADTSQSRAPSSAPSASSSASTSKGKARAPASGESSVVSSASTLIPGQRTAPGATLENEAFLLAAKQCLLSQPVQCPLIIDNVECDAELASMNQLYGHVQSHFGTLWRQPARYKFNIVWCDRSERVHQKERFKDIGRMQEDVYKRLDKEARRYCPVQGCAHPGPHKNLNMHVARVHKSGISEDMLRPTSAPFQRELPELPPLPATAPSYLLSCQPARPNPGGTNTPYWTKTPKYPVHEEYPEEDLIVPDPSVLRHESRKLLSSDIFPSKGDWDEEEEDTLAVTVPSTPVKMGSIALHRTPTHRMSTIPAPAIVHFRALPPPPPTATSGRPMRAAALPAAIWLNAKPALWRIGNNDEVLPKPSLSAKGKAPLQIRPADQRLEVRLVPVPEDVIAEARAAEAVAESGAEAASSTDPQRNVQVVDPVDRKGKRKMTAPADAVSTKHPKSFGVSSKDFGVSPKDLDLAATKFAYNKTGRLFGIDFVKHKHAFLEFHHVMATTHQESIARPISTALLG